MPLLQLGLTYIVSFVALFLFSILFMHGSYIGLVPFISIVPAVILKKAIFPPQYEEEFEEAQ